MTRRGRVKPKTRAEVEALIEAGRGALTWDDVEEIGPDRYWPTDAGLLRIKGRAFDLASKIKQKETLIESKTRELHEVEETIGALWFPVTLLNSLEDGENPELDPLLVMASALAPEDDDNTSDAR